MESKTCRHVTLRLLYSDPEHMKILGILDSLNHDIHKSKNQFIIKAINYYVEHLGEQRECEVNEDSSVITRDDLEVRLKEYKNEIKAELYGDLLKSMLGSGIGSPANITDKSSSLMNDETGNVSGNLSNYSDVLSSVMNWSEDEDN